MTAKNPWIIFAFVMIPFFSLAQRRNAPLSTKNFISYRMGITYPFFSAGDKSYTFSGKSFNYGAHGGIELGHSFGYVFSVALSPSLIYSKFASTDIHYELRMNDPDIFILERNGVYQFSHLSFLVPLVFNFQLKEKIDFGVGAFLLKPMTDRELGESTETHYLYLLPDNSYASYHPPQVNDLETVSNKNTQSYSRKGINGRISYLLNSEHWQQKRIDIEYYHSLTKANLGVYEKWIVVSFKNVFYK